MVNVTFAVADEVHKAMKEHSEVKWSEIARRAIIEYLSRVDENRQWREYSLKKASEEWSAAGDLFDF